MKKITISIITLVFLISACNSNKSHLDETHNFNQTNNLEKITSTPVTIKEKDLYPKIQNFKLSPITPENIHQINNFWSYRTGWSIESKPNPTISKFYAIEKNSLWIFDMENLQTEPKYINLGFHFGNDLRSKKATWSPDGNILAISNGINIVFINSDTGESENNLEVPNKTGYNETNYIAWSPDGNVIALALKQGISFINLNSKTEENYISYNNEVIDDSSIWFMEWNKINGNITLCNSKAQLFLIDEYKKKKDIFNEVSSLCDNISWSPNGQNLLFLSQDGHLRQFNISTEEISELPISEYTFSNNEWSSIFSSIKWSPNGRWLSIVDRFDKIIIFDTKNNEVSKIIDNIPLYWGGVEFCFWQSDSNRILLISNQGSTMREYNLENSLYSPVYFATITEAHFPKFNPSDSRLYVTDWINCILYEWDIKNYKFSRSLLLDKCILEGNFYLSPDGKYIAFIACNDNKTIVLVDTDKFEITNEFSIDNNNILSILWLTNNELFLVSKYKTSIVNINGVLQKTLENEDFFSGVKVISKSPNDKYITLAFLDKIVIIDTTSWKIVEKLAEFTGEISDVSWMPDSSLFAVATNTGAISFWNGDGQSTHSELNINSKIHSLAFSNNGLLLAINDDSGDLKLLETDSFTTIYSISNVTKSNDDLWSDKHIISWNEDSTIIAIGDFYGIHLFGIP